MKSAPQKLMILSVLAILVLPLASSEDSADLEKYLDCLTDKKVDIVFVFDTTNSMGGEINELSAIARDFAADLEASHIDYQLGLLEFRDFPQDCDGSSCGSPGDFAYRVKGNGTLTAEIGTFGSWMKELKAGGGGSGGPEAVMAALRHAGSDILWRDDAEKVIILLTDAGPHPDGSCCNAEGDTLDGTIFGLSDLGARVNVIGPDDASLKRIAENTGGQFYQIRSGLSLKPLLKEITGTMSCSFLVDVEATCQERTLAAEVRLVGKEAVPYRAGQTEAWMYLDQAGSKSRYNLSYDQAAGAYLAEIPDVCGPVELTVYGRVGERSAVQTVQVECGACGAAATEEHGTLSISGHVFADRSNSNGILDPGEVGLNGWNVILVSPEGGAIRIRTDKMGYYIFTGLLPGRYKVVVATNENWVATAPAAAVQDVELIDTHESEKDFGFTSLPELARSIQLASNSGYIIAGDTQGFGGDSKALLIKTDAQGNEIWNRTFGDDWCWAVQPTSDGGCILLSETGAFSVGGCDAWLVKVDANGFMVWNLTFGSTNVDRARSFLLTSDGGYILAGETWSFGAGGCDAWLVKVDAKGNEVWNRTFGGANLDGAESIQTTSDGGYILSGDTRSFGLGDDDHIEPWLIKTDLQGHELWNKTFGIDFGFTSVNLTSDGGYILAGQTYSADAAGWDAWLIKTDTNGNELWSRTFGGTGYDKANSFQPTSDGGYILAGITSSFGAGGIDAWLIKTDVQGNELWNRTFGGSNDDSAYSVQPTPDGGYILGGDTESFGVVGGGALLIKTDAEGNEVWRRIFNPAHS